MASEVVSQTDTTQTSQYDLDLNLLKSGDLYLNNSLIQGQTISSGANYVLRWTVIDRPTQFVPELKIALHLPTPINEQAVDYQLINNGGALTATSELVDPQTIAFDATDTGSTNTFGRIGGIRDEADKGLPGFINLIGIDSPGLTCSLSIARSWMFALMTRWSHLDSPPSVV